MSLVWYLLILTSCNVEDPPFRKIPIVNGQNLKSLDEACQKLTKCIGGKGVVVHMADQSSDPFVCWIKTDIDNLYFYPDLDPVDYKPTFNGFRQAIEACEMATKTGQHSKKYLDERTKSLIEWSKNNAKRRKAEKEDRIKEQKPVHFIEQENL